MWSSKPNWVNNIKEKYEFNPTKKPEKKKPKNQDVYNIHKNLSSLTYNDYRNIFPRFLCLWDRRLVTVWISQIICEMSESSNFIFAQKFVRGSLVVCLWRWLLIFNSVMRDIHSLQGNHESFVSNTFF